MPVTNQLFPRLPHLRQLPDTQPDCFSFSPRSPLKSVTTTQGDAMEARMRASEAAGAQQVVAARDIASRFLEQRFKNEHNAARDAQFEARLLMQVRRRLTFPIAPNSADHTMVPE